MTKPSSHTPNAPAMSASADAYIQELYQALKDRGIITFVALHPDYGGIVYATPQVNREKAFPYLAKMLLRSMDDDDIQSDHTLHHVDTVPPHTDD